MAESSGKAFGRYLRMLRERRGLSLDDVRSLSQTFPETITKSYISRCENGYHKLALPKLIPLSRIYEVPADAVLERMELDLELDRLGGPDTEGKSFADLRSDARESSDRGCRWDAYAYTRDALSLAQSSSVLPDYQDQREQVLVAILNTATAAGSLGRHRFALHESLHVAGGDGLSRTFADRARERVAYEYRSLGQIELAQRYVDDAISSAETTGDAPGLACMCMTRGLIAADRADTGLALSWYQRSHEIHRRLGNTKAAALALCNLVEVYQSREQLSAARRACEAALRLLSTDPRCRQRAVALMQMGRLEELAGRSRCAAEHWREATDVARALNDRALRFRIDLHLLRRAVEGRDESVARAIQRRMTKLSPWIPPELAEELAEFRRLTPLAVRSTHVSRTQRKAFRSSN